MNQSAGSPRIHQWPRHRHLSVLGMASALPGPALETAELLARVEQRFGLSLRGLGSALARRMNIRSRHVCREFLERHESPRGGQSNPELCAQAVSRALKQAGLEIDDLSYLIGHTATPSLPLPSNISQVASLLNYTGPFAEFRQACTGFINATVMAAGLLEDPGCGVVAIVGSETGSVFCDPFRLNEDRGQLVNFIQMGDGAAAVLLARPDLPGQGTISCLYHGQVGGGRPAGLCMKCGGSDNPGSGGRAVLEFDHDFESIRRHGLDLMLQGVRVMERQDIAWSEIDYVIPHQANGVLDTLLAPYLEPSVTVLVQADTVGNTGSAAIWLALLEASQSRMRPGQSAWVLGAEATQFMFGGFRYVQN